MRNIIAVAILVVSSSTALAQTPDAAAPATAKIDASGPSGRTECKQAAATRTITLAPGEQGKGCKVVYVKEDGTSKSLWASQHDVNYCTPKAKGFVKKLSGQGWKCEGEITAE